MSSKVRREPDSVSLSRNCSCKSSAFQTFPYSHFSPTYVKSAMRVAQENEASRDRIWTGRVKMTKESSSITEKQNGTKWVNKIKF